MSDKKQHQQLFYLLKQALKSRGYTYANIAQELNVSENTIKRLFRDKDCKMSRLIEVCDVIGLSLSDLIAMQERMHAPARYLAIDIEEKLAQNPGLFTILVLLVSQISPQNIAAQYQLSETALYQYLRKLEELNIIEIIEGNEVRFTVPLPIGMRFKGPLNKAIKQVNRDFISHCIDNENQPDCCIFTSSRLMSESSYALIKERLAQLQRDYEYFAAQDQLFYRTDELSLYKMSAGFGLFPAMSLCPLEA